MTGGGLKVRAQIVAESFFMLADFVAGSACIATVPRRYARIRREQLPLRLIRADFDLPGLRENLYTPAHLTTDPGLAWLKKLIMEEAVAMLADD